MESTHTPGPWTFKLDAHGRGIINANGCWIGTTWTKTDDDVAVTYPAEANARLIAAAPDLLDFAARFEAAVGFLVAGLPTNHAVAKDLIGLRDTARAALSKAKGGEA